MRRWTLTLFLAAAAAGAAVLAPRLRGAAPTAPTAPVVAPAQSVIPEVLAPPAIVTPPPPVAPAPPPEAFWPDLVDCGMG